MIMKKMILILGLVLVDANADLYPVYGLDGRKLGVEECSLVTECASNARRKYSQQTVLVNEKNVRSMYSNSQISEKSQDTIWTDLKDTVIWIATEKNKIESICVNDSNVGMWVVLNGSHRVQSDNCMQIHSGNIVGISTFQIVSEKNDVYTFNVLTGLNYIDLSKSVHLLGFHGDEYQKKELVVYTDPIKEYANRIYPDPERKESINEVLIVDKYPVTNCDFIQVLWDSIPRVSMSKNENMTRYHNHWIERKEKMIKNERCDTHDSAAIKIYLYDALIYANARSVRDGFEPVYKFEKIKQKNHIPSLYENGDFDVFTMSFFEKYEDSDADWLRVKVDKSADGYRLPYYDEWMALARGGTANRRYIWGENEDPAIASQYAWFGAGKVISEKYGVYQQDSRPVGMLKPNAYGLYDMLGLVCENVMLPGKSIFANEITSCKGGFLYDSLEKLNFGAHEDNWNAGYGGYQGLRLVRQIK